MANRLLPLKEKSLKTFYRVIEVPAPLAGMPLPSDATDWSALAEKGFKYVVSLESTSPSYNPAPLTVLCAVELEDLYMRPGPRDPKREVMLITKVVKTVMAKLNNGEGVVIHCYGGRGRTGTVIGCILKKLGYDSREIVTYLDILHKHRGKEGWPESPWQSKLVERF